MRFARDDDDAGRGIVKLADAGEVEDVEEAYDLDSFG